MSIVSPNEGKVKHDQDLPIIHPTRADTPLQRLASFLCVLLGILAQWFWPIGVRYVGDPTSPLMIGPPTAVFVQLLLSTCVAALVFVPVYLKIRRTTNEVWMVLFLAFQYGFFWQFAFSALARSYQG